MVNIPYYVFVLIFILVSICFAKSKCAPINIIGLLFGSSMVILIAFFYGYRLIDPMHGGYDTKAYHVIYNGITLDNVFSQRIEKGFAFLMLMCKLLGCSFQGFMTAFYMIISLAYYKVCREITNNAFTIFSFLSFSLFFIDSFNISRMVLGGFVSFIGIIYLSKEQNKKALFFICLSAAFQMTYIWVLGIMIYHMISKKLTRNKKILFYFVCFSLSILSVSIFKYLLLSVGYGHYLNDDGTASYLNYIYALLLWGVMYFFVKSKIRNEVSLVIISLLPTMLFIIPLYSTIPIAYRFNYIYMLFFAFLIPEFFAYVTNLKKNNIYMIFIILIPITYNSIKVISYFQNDVHYSQAWVVIQKVF